MRDFLSSSHDASLESESKNPLRNRSSPEGNGVALSHPWQVPGNYAKWIDGAIWQRAVVSVGFGLQIY